ncbi:MAG: TIGR02302 family protein [Alphaproteobacteria bacterium]|nr:TIGR02302 family protein [Alphaproteobacteria bacterium]
MSAAPERIVPARRVALARFALFWERLWPSLWPALLVIGSYAVLGLFELPAWLPPYVHLGIVVLVVLVTGYFVLRAIARSPWPTEGEATRRIEIASGMPHRPLAALADGLADAKADAATRGIWAAHLRRMAELAKNQRVGWPAAGLARTGRDPYALRAVLFLLGVVGLGIAGTDAPARLRDAFLPRPGLVIAGPVMVEGWIAPPAYTSVAPIYVGPDRQAAAGSIRVPIGSQAILQLRGSGREKPVLALGEASVPFEKLEGGTFQVETEIRAGDRLAVVEGKRELAAWPMTVVPDHRPTIEFATPPSATLRSALRLDYLAKDDYGLVAVRGQIWRAETAGADGLIELELPVPGLRPKSAKAASFHDLTAHVFAGLKVIVELHARDDLDQIGLSEQFEMVLPERTFNHPVARALVEQRKKLTVDPGQRRAVGAFLDLLTGMPDRYGGDVVAHLLIRIARSSLLGRDGEEAIPYAQNLLWDAALHLEEGSLSEAERDLRAAWQALADALDRNAPESELERLMQDLREALDRYLQALAEQAIREAENNPHQGQQPVDPDRMLSQQDLQRMLDRMQDMARSGARQAARDMLERLRDMLENLRMAMPGMQGDNRMSQGQRNMRDLGDLMRRQQQLLDRTFRQSQRGQQGQQGQRGQQGQDGDDQDGSPGDLSREQESIRRALRELMGRMGEQGTDIPGALGRAEQAMRDARRALEGGDAPGALGPEGQALDQLRLGAEQAMRDMAGQGQGPGPGDPGGEPQQRGAMRQADPFGRDYRPPNSGDGVDESGVVIPDEMDLQRSRDILDELRRRSGDTGRPRLERDYIDRLLKRF